MTDSSTAGSLEGVIDFSVPGIFVRSILDPAKTGHTTGNVIRHAGRSYALLRLKSGEVGQFACEHLEPVPEVETRVEAVGSLRLAGPEHLHRAILTEKVRGRLTEVFYSMGTGHAEFYPHQCAFRGRRPRCPAHGDHVIQSMTTGAAPELDGAVGCVF